MSADYDDPNGEFEVEADEYPFTVVPDWVAIGVTNSDDLRVFHLLRMHVNHKRGDGEAWPSQATLATVMGYSKPDKVGESIKRLEAMGALSRRVVAGPNGRYTKYKLHMTPRPGITYRGPRCSADLYRDDALIDLWVQRVAPKQRPRRTPTTKREDAKK